MTTAVTIKKVRSGDISYGRGVDNNRSSATYAVMLDGVRVATIEPMHHSLRYMDLQDWRVLDAGGKHLRTFYGMSGSPFRKAKDYCNGLTGATTAVAGSDTAPAGATSDCRTRA